jgi:hypothetical protein
MHALLERDAEQLIRKLIDKALDGDAACLKLCTQSPAGTTMRSRTKPKSSILKFLTTRARQSI